MKIIQRDEQYLLNYCTKYLARGKRYIDTPPTAATPDNPNLKSNKKSNNLGLETVSEAWRFPIINSASEPDRADSLYDTHNEVTFIYFAPEHDVKQVAVVGDFATFYTQTPLEPINFLEEPTGYFALSVILPVERCYHYRFIVDGKMILDPINPQRVTLPNGKEWSRFFTDFYTQPISFRDWELKLLYRLVQHILPFRTKSAQNFLNRFYKDKSAAEKQNMSVYQLDQTVGEVNYIDKVVAREEWHHLIDYKLALKQIDLVLRQRNRFVESWEVDQALIIKLYDEMATKTNEVPGWDKDAYRDPAYFLGLLRRHAITGAFCHPKYGGNVAGAGWAYLEEQFRDPKTDKTLFDWRAAIEKPLGTSQDYMG